MKHRLKPSQCAFTLIELLVVITIISILASFSAPQFIQHITKAKLLEVYSFSNTVQSAIEEHILVTGAFPNTSQFNNLKTQQNLSEKSLISSADIEQSQGVTGTIKIQLKEESGIEASQYYLFARTTSAKWTCTSSLPSSLLSDHCENISSNEEPDDDH